MIIINNKMHLVYAFWTSENGNTHNNEPTKIYKKVDKNKKYLKTGMAKNPKTRYTEEQKAGGRTIEIVKDKTYSRKRAAEIERFIIERNPGPENLEKFAGKRKPGHKNYDPNYKPPHMNKKGK